MRRGINDGGGDEALEAVVRRQTIGRVNSTANIVIKGLLTVPPITAVDESKEIIK